MIDLAASRSRPLSLSLVSLLTACATAPVAPATPVIHSAALAPRGGARSPAPTRLDARDMVLALEGHGRWIDTARYGPAWVPDASRDRSFAPYVTRGRWVASDAGWFWRSDDAWGAVTFHYGRWTLLDDAWTWVPGAAFAPAWVEWRSGDGWVGWSPIPPAGDLDRSPFAYASANALAGDGLAGRAIVGAAAVSLYTRTQPSPAPAVAASRPLDEVWRASSPDLADTTLSNDGAVVARLVLPDTPSARIDAESTRSSPALGRSYEVARAAIAPRPRSSVRIAEYAPVHMPPPVESWPAPGSFRFGAPLRAASAETVPTMGAAPYQIIGITPTFSGASTPPAAPVQSFVATGAIGLSAPPPTPSSGVTGSPIVAQ